ncbi:MAG: hypothetical protein RLZZ500_361 [Bacteroidota bacterium]|jgi:four helix bundle protein
MYSFRELEIWKKSQDFCTSIFRGTSPLPGHPNQIYVLELRQLSVMLPTHIALAYQSQSKADFLRFLDFSLGAAYEIQTHLLIAEPLTSLTLEQKESLQKEVNQLIELIGKIREHVKQIKFSSKAVLFTTT